MSRRARLSVLAVVVGVAAALHAQQRAAYLGYRREVEARIAANDAKAAELHALVEGLRRPSPLRSDTTRAARGPGGAIGAAFPVMAAYGAARFGAPSEAITASEQRLSDLQDRRAKLEVVAQKLEPFQQQVIELGRKLVTLRAIVPVSDDPEVLVAQVQSIAARSGVTLVAVSSQPAVAKGGLYREVPLQVEAVAGPAALVTFVDRLFRLPRLVVMPELAIEAPSGGRRTLLLRTRIVGFAIPDGAR